MPAEWSAHEATWITWPHKRSDWPGKFAPIPWVYVEIVRKLAPGERLRVLVGDAGRQRAASRALADAGVDLARVEFFRLLTDRGWNRDMGPIFVLEASGAARIARFRFNGWAKYDDWRKDDRVPERAAKALGVPLSAVAHRGREVVLEGGAIDVNGEGALLTTEECLLDPAVQVRNPGFTRADYESVFRSALGANHVLWLGRGIAGDDTHGHVDDLCRFVKPRTVVLCREKNGRDPNHRPLEENAERLQGARLADGSRLEVVDLPMPAPLFFRRQRLPASYANFYIGNETVIVPTFNDPADRQAIGILAECFPDRTVVGLHAVDLVLGLGTLHCLTQQQPKAAE
jgi:agmatine deiminase